MGKVMKIKLGQNQPEPKYHTKGSAGFDLCATETMKLPVNTVSMMDLEIACEIPSGYYGKLVVRSSMAKRGIALAHGTGIIDSDYRGTIKAPLISLFYDEIVKNGERIVQLLICPVIQVDIDIVDSLDSTERGSGGFGSTN